MNYSERETVLINEAKLRAKVRNSLDDSVFGIPETRSYPMPDKAHVKAAIRMFNHVDRTHEKELASRILSKMKQYCLSTDMIGENNKLRKYIK